MDGALRLCGGLCRARGRGGVVFECEGTVEGEIVPAPRGTGGFGYDPIFAYPPDGRTGGELTDAEKLAVSHRGRAFRQFREWLMEGAGGPTG